MQINVPEKYISTYFRDNKMYYSYVPMQKSFLASFTYLYPISSVGTEETNVTLEKISAANKYLYVYLLNYM